MRSSRSGRSKGQDPPLFPTAWSEWEWSDQFKCYQRYRLKGPEDYEWDYGQVQSSALPRTQPSPSLSDDFGSLEISDDQYTTSPNADTTSPVVLDQRNVFCTWPLCSQSFNTVNERDRHFRTIHSNNGDRPYRCVVDGCPAGVTSWTTAVKLRVHNKTWHGPYACSVPTCPRRAPNGFATQADLDIHTRDEHGKSPPSGFSGMEATVGIDTDATPLSSKVFSEYSAIASEDIKPKFTNNIRPHTPTNYITSRDFSTDRESFDPHYKVHGAWEFKWGRVFKTLWAEPKGDDGNDSGSGGSGTVSVRKGKHGEIFHAKVRRFVVISKHEGHCICLPIMTYGGQGVKKRGVHASHHAIIYTDKPIISKGEKEKGLTKKPVKVIPSSPRHKLDRYSRLNYAKTYTVEYNVKVWFIGKVDKESEWQLKTDYNRIHPPLDTRGIPSSFAEDAIYEESMDYTSLYSATLDDPSSWQTQRSTLFPSAGISSTYNSMGSGAPPSTDTTSSQLIGAGPFSQINRNNLPSPFQSMEAPEDPPKNEKQDQDNDHGLQNPKAPKDPHQPEDQDQDDAHELQKSNAPEDPHQAEDLDEEYQSIKNREKEDLLYDDLDIYDAEA